MTGRTGSWSYERLLEMKMFARQWVCFHIQHKLLRFRRNSIPGQMAQRQLLYTAQLILNAWNISLLHLESFWELGKQDLVLHGLWLLWKHSKARYIYIYTGVRDTDLADIKMLRFNNDSELLANMERWFWITIYMLCRSQAEGSALNMTRRPVLCTTTEMAMDQILFSL